MCLEENEAAELLVHHEVAAICKTEAYLAALKVAATTYRASAGRNKVYFRERGRDAGDPGAAVGQFLVEEGRAAASLIKEALARCMRR